MDDNTTQDNLLMDHEQDGLHPGYGGGTYGGNQPDTSMRGFGILLFIMITFLGVFCLALFKYDQSHNTDTQAYRTLQSDLTQVNAKQTALAAQNKQLTTSNATLTTKLTELQNEKTQFCTELGRAKINDPLCTE